PEARYVLERASARETTSRVAAGGLAKLLLRELGIEVLSHVIGVGGASISGDEISWEQIVELSKRDEVLLNCADAEAEQRMKAEVDQVYKTADTVGGVFEVRAHQVPPGLGTYVNWDERLDARLAAAVMSIQAVKGVEIGSGMTAAVSHGSDAQDPIGYEKLRPFAGFTRPSNRAGGLEGGVTNGEDVIVRGYLKPISTLRRPLPSVDFATREPVQAAYERSDVCVVPAAGVVAEAMVALVLAQAALEKFGGDSLRETKRNFEGYIAQLRDY
ncbi:MAG: chorismate synthase, partial [Terriglobales bacterium]